MLASSTYGPSTAVIYGFRVSREVFGDDGHIVSVVLLYQDSSGNANDACEDPLDTERFNVTVSTPAPTTTTVLRAPWTEDMVEGGLCGGPRQRM